MENNMTHEESLSVITEMIQKAQIQFTDNGQFYLLWGWVALLASILHFIGLYYWPKFAWLPWAILMPLAGIASGVLGSRMSRQKASSHFEKIMGYLWGGMTIVLLVVLVQGARVGWDVAYPMLILLWGWATFVSGGILKFKPLVAGGILSLILGAAAFWMPFHIQILTIAASMIFTYLLPGYMLRSQSRKHAAGS
jgi:hypothetical protein